MTGYAISADSLWRQHSWCYDRRRQRVVETTERRVAYLGFRMTVNEAVWFRDNNLD